MRVLFSADWHLKLNTKNIPDTWAVNRYNLLFKEIYRLEKQADLHIIGGDLFDRVPTLAEIELYYRFIIGCSIKTIIYSGNHEALKKNTTFLTFLKETTSLLNPLVSIIDDYYTIDNTIDIIPYNKLKEFDPKNFSSPILCTHVRGEIPPHVKPEIDLELFKSWEIVLAGDLHSYSNSQRNILYPGSPVTTSFHRSEVSTGAIILDTATMEHSWERLEVPQLIRKTVTAGTELVPTSYNHTIYEVEGDIAELSEVANSELLDKKVSKKDSDVALILSPEMTIEEELTEYLTYLLGLPQNTIDEVLKEFHDNIKTTIVG